MGDVFDLGEDSPVVGVPSHLNRLLQWVHVKGQSICVNHFDALFYLVHSPAQ